MFTQDQIVSFTDFLSDWQTCFFSLLLNKSTFSESAKYQQETSDFFLCPAASLVHICELQDCKSSLICPLLAFMQIFIFCIIFLTTWDALLPSETTTTTTTSTPFMIYDNFIHSCDVWCFFIYTSPFFASCSILSHVRLRLWNILYKLLSLY